VKITVAQRDLDMTLKVVSSSIDLSGTGSDGKSVIKSHFLFRDVGTEEKPQIEILSAHARTFSGSPLLCKVEYPEGDWDAQTKMFSIGGKRLQMWLEADLGDKALTFNYDSEEKVTTAKSKRGTQKFRGLDPEDFPFWDSVLGDAKVEVKINADHLHGVLDHLKKFVSSDDTNHPEFCATELITGSWYAAEKFCATQVKIPAMAGASIRIFGKNIKAIQDFLNLADGQDVEILGHSRFALYRRTDGAVFGESKPSHKFPKFNAGEDDPDAHVWTLNKADVRAAILHARAGASFEDERVWFRPLEGKEIEIGMARVAGGNSFTQVTCSEMTSGTDAKAIPDNGFPLSYKELEKVLDSYSEDDVPFGITPKGGPNGIVRFMEKREKDQYITLVAWRKK